MTTRINVNVDQQALLQRSREQTQANRWAFLEGQNRSKVGKEAERQREANRAARGFSADGSMYNNRLRQLPQRPEPAAWRTGLTADIGHTWVEATVTDTAQSSSTGLIGGSSATSGYTEPAVQRGGKSAFKVRSGNGGVTTSYPLGVGAIKPELPTNGYSNWATGYTAAYTFGYGWYYGVYGLRTYRADSRNERGSYVLVLPAGRSSCVIFVFSTFYGHTIDKTRVVAKEVQVGGGQTMPIIFSTVKSEADLTFASYYAPGAYVTFKRNYGYLDQGITDGSGNPIPTAYAWDADGNELPIASPGYVPLDPYPTNETTGFPHLVQTWGESSTKVYFCSPTTAKEITPSSALQAFIDYWNPQPQDSTIVIDGVSLTVPSPNFRISTAGLQRASNFYENDYFFNPEVGGSLSRATNTWDPRIFQSLNAAHQFTDPSNILDATAIRYQVRSDTRVGAYAVSPGDDYGFSQDQPYYYGKAKAAEDDDVIGTRADRVSLAAGRAPLEGGQFHRVWDWDRPDYCRARLLDMGFTEADLTP